MRRLRPIFAALVCALPLLAAGCTAETADVAPPDPGRSATARGDNVALVVSTDRSSCEVGQPITLTLRTEGGASPPELPEKLGPFDVRVLPSDPAQPSTRRATLVTFDSGSLQIPPIELTLADGSTVATEPIALEVTSLLGGDDDPSHFRDIKSAVALAPESARWPWIAGGIAGAGAIALALLLLLRRRHGGTHALSPDEFALAAFASLEAERLPESGRVHEFYVRLADIVRVYVEARYGIRAPELTTQEFLREAKRSSIVSEPHQTLLAGFLRAADMVKFAGSRPAQPECAASLTAARRFVEETRPAADSTASGSGTATGGAAA